MLAIPTARVVPDASAPSTGAPPGPGGAFNAKTGRAAKGADNPFSRLLSALRGDARPGGQARAAGVADASARDGALRAGAAAQGGKARADRAADPGRIPDNAVRPDAQASAAASARRAAALAGTVPSAAPDNASSDETAARPGKRRTQAPDPRQAAAAAVPESPPQDKNRAQPTDGGSDAVKSASAPGKSQAKVSVVDLRLRAMREPGAGSERGDAQAGNPAGARGVNDAGASPVLAATAPAPAAGTAATPEPAAGTPTSGQAAGLAARLREDGAADIVRAAQVVLKDGDMGLIRLRLEPETLGGVKIELKMAEKQISGRIVVESDLAGEAFRSSLDALKDAFAEAGFETTSLEVEVRNGDGGNGGGQARDGDGNRVPFWSTGFRELDHAVPPAPTAAAPAGGLNMIV